MNLRKFQKEIHANAVEKGFYFTNGIQNMVPEKLCLIHSEVSEALECIRQQNVEFVKEEFGEELADVIIRVLDLAEYCGIDMTRKLIEKHTYNKGREYLHGKQF